MEKEANLSPQVDSHLRLTTYANQLFDLAEYTTPVEEVLKDTPSKNEYLQKLVTEIVHEYNFTSPRANPMQEEDIRQEYHLERLGYNLALHEPQTTKGEAWLKIQRMPFFHKIEFSPEECIYFVLVGVNEVRKVAYLNERLEMIENGRTFHQVSISELPELINTYELKGIPEKLSFLRFTGGFEALEKLAKDDAELSRYFGYILGGNPKTIYTYLAIVRKGIGKPGHFMKPSNSSNIQPFSESALVKVKAILQDISYDKEQIQLIDDYLIWLQTIK